MAGLAFLMVVVLTSGCVIRGSTQEVTPNCDCADGQVCLDGVCVDGDVAMDAATPGDGAVPLSLSQTSSSTVVATQVACQQTPGSLTNENSYYRTFPLGDFGITSPFHVTNVAFAVERATAGSGGAQPAVVRLGAYTGVLDVQSFPLASLTTLATASITIPNNATTVVVPISSFSPSNLTVQPGSILYVEVFIPNGVPAGNIFFIGSTNGTETHPSYLRAPACGVMAPTTYAQAAQPGVRLLITVNGTR